MIDTAIFDMDGLLLDTERLWEKSMLHVAERHGIEISRALFKETTGLRIYEVTDHWALHFPWQGSTSIQVADEILDHIIAATQNEGNILHGVLDALELLHANRFKVGLASSSPRRMISALLHHFGISKFFRQVSSSDDVPLGKPHPAVFLHCAEGLGSQFHQCVVFEDSVNGMVAAKAARMKVIVVPDDAHRDDPRFALADICLHSMEDFKLEMLHSLHR